MAPGLGAILGPFSVSGKPVVRPVHIYGSESYVRDGVVLIGDAFSTTCPASGTGADKVLTDVERLAALIPEWLASAGMDRGKIARFYGDRVKRACDRNAVTMAAYARSMAIDHRASWIARRWRNYYAHQLRSWLRRQVSDAGLREASLRFGSRRHIGRLPSIE